ncbi:MAG: septum formation initiator family protein [Candidatus Saccharibacteria bacterium]|nr:septum formation initiator family protein [Candidatus Saccharibacteria bacterium]
MLNKVKTHFNSGKLQFLNDTKNLGLIAFGVIALLVSWSGVNSIQANYELQKQISELSQQNTVAELENTNLKLRNEYLKTDQYLELAARRQFGKAAPGETVVNVPKKVALANTVEPKNVAVKVATTEESKPFYLKNLQAWVDFFLHRDAANG